MSNITYYNLVETAFSLSERSDGDFSENEALYSLTLEFLHETRKQKYYSFKEILSDPDLQFVDGCDALNLDPTEFYMAVIEHDTDDFYRIILAKKAASLLGEAFGDQSLNDITIAYKVLSSAFENVDLLGVEAFKESFSECLSTNDEIKALSDA